MWCPGGLLQTAYNKLGGRACLIIAIYLVCHSTDAKGHLGIWRSVKESSLVILTLVISPAGLFFLFSTNRKWLFIQDRFKFVDFNHIKVP